MLLPCPPLPLTHFRVAPQVGHKGVLIVVAKVNVTRQPKRRRHAGCAVEGPIHVDIHQAAVGTIGDDKQAATRVVVDAVRCAERRWLSGVALAAKRNVGICSRATDKLVDESLAVAVRHIPAGCTRVKKRGATAGNVR